MRRRMDVLDHPAFLALTTGADVLEQDAHGDKVLRLADGSFVKLFRRKRVVSSTAWYPYAQRFADNAEALAQRGIPVPRVIDIWRIPSIKRDAVHYHPLEGVTLRSLNRPESNIDLTALKKRFTDFIIRLHRLGIYFRSLHLGNVILTPAGELGLIDFSDLRIYRASLPIFMRRRNIRRMLEMPAESDWIDTEAILAAHRN